MEQFWDENFQAYQEEEQLEPGNIGVRKNLKLRQGEDRLGQ